MEITALALAAVHQPDAAAMLADGRQLAQLRERSAFRPASMRSSAPTTRSTRSSPSYADSDDDRRH